MRYLISLLIIGIFVLFLIILFTATNLNLKSFKRMFGPEFVTLIRICHFYSDYVLGSFSYLVNGTVLYFMLKKSKKDVEVYKLSIIMGSLSNVITSLAGQLFHLELELINGSGFIIINGIGYFFQNPYVHDCLMLIWAITFYFNVFISPTAYIYRYLLLCRYAISLYQSNTYLFLISRNIRISKFKLGLLMLSTYFFSFIPIKGKNALNLPNLNYDSWSDIFILSKIVLTCSTKDLWLKICAVSMITIIPLNNSIIIFCSIRIYKKLKEDTEHMSNKTKQLQKQMTRILFIQAFSPFILAGVPLTCSVIAFNLDLSIYGLAELSLALMAAAPLLSGCSTLFLSKDFWTRIKAVKVRSSIRAKNVTANTSSSKTAQPSNFTFNIHM
uniref:Serpentine Receptor, class J n=1 Tax=Rhabditophanes sp. KR3021 TaxID=114890 RepID=A0AC35TJS7_9BILA